jgi:hypothetical protein
VQAQTVLTLPDVQRQAPLLAASSARSPRSFTSFALA